MGRERGVLEPGSFSVGGHQAAPLLLPTGLLPHRQRPALHAECPWGHVLAVHPPPATGNDCPFLPMLLSSLMFPDSPSLSAAQGSFRLQLRNACCPSSLPASRQLSLSTQGMAPGWGKPAPPSLSPSLPRQCGSLFPRSMASCPSSPCSFQSSGFWRPPVEKPESWRR